jgi:putative transposase
MSERRACLLVAADRKMVRYRSRRPPDVKLRTCATLPTDDAGSAIDGCSFVHSAAGTGRAIGHQPHLSRGRADSSQLQGPAQAIGTRTPILVEAKVNARWSLDPQHRGRRHA